MNQRHPLRLVGYDYTLVGAYFVTLVTYERKTMFGDISEDVMHLTDLGKIVQEEWLRSASLREEIRVYPDEFVIMPNHLHGIVWIVPVGADGVRPEVNTRQIYGQGDTSDRQKPVRQPRSLGGVIAGFKASVTSRAKRELGLGQIWQRNYYDRIIRDADEFRNIWNYLDDNPRRWGDVQLNPVIDGQGNRRRG